MLGLLNSQVDQHLAENQRLEQTLHDQSTVLETQEKQLQKDQETIAELKSSVDALEKELQVSSCTLSTPHTLRPPTLHRKDKSAQSDLLSNGTHISGGFAQAIPLLAIVFMYIGVFPPLGLLF